MSVLLPPAIVDGLLHNGKVAFRDGAYELYVDIMLDCDQFRVVDSRLFHKRLVGVHCTRYRSVAQLLLAQFHLGAATLTVYNTVDTWLNTWLGTGTMFVCQDWPALPCVKTRTRKSEKYRKWSLTRRYYDVHDQSR